MFASPAHLSQLHFTDAAGNVNLLDKHMKPWDRTGVGLHTIWKDQRSV